MCQSGKASQTSRITALRPQLSMRTTSIHILPVAVQDLASAANIQECRAFVGKNLDKHLLHLDTSKLTEQNNDKGLKVLFRKAEIYS